MQFYQAGYWRFNEYCDF